MDPISAILSSPTELEIWLILGYVAVVLAGARLSEAVARVHFERARRYATHGFAYDAEADQYHCPEGERLPLQVVEPTTRLAVYRAPASRCNSCARKESCTPHDQGRHLYRPLAAWAETDVGRFHRWLSRLMVAAGMIFSLGGLIRWAGQPGTGLLMLALAVGLSAAVREIRLARAESRQDVEHTE